MGTWGATAFEDDTAMEFYDEYCSSGQSLNELESCLDKVLTRQYNMKEFLMEGFMEPVKALVCAEIIAASIGKPVDTFPDDEYHKDMETPKIDLPKLSSQINNDIKDKAKKTLTKIVEAKDIHLTTLWLESESFEEWKNYINDLITRLN
jgi:Domain of unknown function (DUF4259)